MKACVTTLSLSADGIASIHFFFTLILQRTATIAWPDAVDSPEWAPIHRYRVAFRALFPRQQAATKRTNRSRPGKGANRC
jgi:hypothetical protein